MNPTDLTGLRQRLERPATQLRDGIAQAQPAARRCLACQEAAERG